MSEVVVAAGESLEHASRTLPGVIAPVATVPALLGCAKGIDLPIWAAVSNLLACRAWHPRSADRA